MKFAGKLSFVLKFRGLILQMQSKRIASCHVEFRVRNKSCGDLPPLGHIVKTFQASQVFSFLI